MSTVIKAENLGKEVATSDGRFQIFSALNISAAPVNINTADANAISSNLKGIGMVKAQAVIEYRKVHGNFENAESLTQVKGIGSKTINKNKKDIIL